ncbi:hypothetical protein ACNKHO_09190 [Shigella flexneri]
MLDGLRKGRMIRRNTRWITSWSIQLASSAEMKSAMTKELLEKNDNNIAPSA